MLDADAVRRGAAARRRASTRTRIASRPSAPDHSAQCGSWSRASGATDSQASSGMYGGLQTTTSTVPARSSNGVGHVAEPQVDPGAGQVALGPGVGRRVQLDGVHRARGHLVGDRPGDRAGAGARGRRRPGVSDRGRPARSPSRPAARSRAAGTKTPGPTSSSTWRKYGGPGQVLQRLARGPAGDQGVVRLARRRRGTDSTSGQPAAVGAEHVGEQLGRVVAPGWPRPRRPAASAAPTSSSRAASPLERVEPGARGRPRRTSRSRAGGRRRAPGRGCRPCSRCGGRRSGSPGSCRCGSARSGRRCGPG